MSRNLKKTLPFKARLFLEHPKVLNKPWLLSHGKTQRLFDYNNMRFNRKGQGFNKVVSVIFVIVLVFYVGYNYFFNSSSTSSESQEISNTLTAARDLTGIWE